MTFFSSCFCIYAKSEQEYDFGIVVYGAGINGQAIHPSCPSLKEGILICNYRSIFLLGMCFGHIADVKYLLLTLNAELYAFHGVSRELPGRAHITRIQLLKVSAFHDCGVLSFCSEIHTRTEC